VRKAYAELAQWAFAIALGTSFLWLVLTFLLPIDQAFMDALNRHHVYWFALIGIGLVATVLAKRSRD
jgi:hypothetical protein